MPGPMPRPTTHDGKFPMVQLRPGDVFRLTRDGSDRTVIEVEQRTPRHPIVMTFTTPDFVKPATLRYPRRQKVYRVGPDTR